MRAALAKEPGGIDRVEAGVLPDPALPLEQAREALARVAGRHARGKIVLQIGQG